MSPFEERFPRIWAFLEQVSLILFGGILFWVFACFLITLPAAFTALFAAVAPLFRPAAGDVFGRFWRGFCRSFGRALILGVADVGLGLILYMDIRFFWSLNSIPGKVAAFALGSIAAAVALVNVFLWPMLAWYPQPVMALLRRSFLLAGAHPFLAIGGLLGAALCLVALISLPWPLMGLLPALGPGLVALAIGLAAYKAMRPYAGVEDEFTQ